MFVDLKVILDRQPLQIGQGRLPNWFRNKHKVISLDTYNDNLCLFRCIAVHQGANKQFNTRRAKELAQSFFATYTKLTAVTSQQFNLLEKHFKQGIAVYSVRNADDFILIHQPSDYEKVSHPTISMGIYEGHAFVIKDINKVTNNYTCGECMARFTKSCNLTHHIKTCTSGRTEINCPGYQILAPESAFKKAFYPEGTFGKKGICWLEHVSQQSGKHIHHHKIIINVATGAKDSSKVLLLMAINLKPKLSSIFMVATGTVVSSASLIQNKEPKLFRLTKMANKQHEKSRT